MRLLLELRIPFGLCFPFDSSRQGGNPGPLVANLFAVETHYLVAPGWRVYRCGNSREVLLSRGEELVAARKNAVARFGFENVEQADADTEGVLRRNLVLWKVGQPAHQFLFSFGSEGVDFAGLPALARGLAFADPGVFDETAEQRIDEIVVHGAVAGDQADLFFEGVAVLGTGQESGEK
jgi:hypothetical protein